MLITRVETLASRKVAELGLNDNQFESINTLKNMPSGLVIVSGPKGSGVTSTFYALLGNHDPFLNNIITLEKKPAVALDNITQNEYTLSDSTMVSYGRQLLTLIRRGPDIIGVADCEDSETAKVALDAANDGKIVYVTLEADSVNAAVEKWLKLVGDKEEASKSLEAVLNQRLARMLCEDCRQAYQPNQALFKKFNIPANEVGMFYRPGEIEYDKHGKPIICETCQGTGFYGRIGLFETIRLNAALKEVVRTAKSVNEITAAFRKAGMLYMQEQSIKKVSAGTTSINEIIRNFSSK